MLSKIMIKGEIEVITGMHIGTGGEIAAIGAADSPVITDAITTLPIIPGSTLKGKMRSVLAKKYNKGRVDTPEDDCKEIKNLFGGMKRPGRVIFSDMVISNMDELEKDYNIYYPTEIKFENTIKRLTGEATPRQIERVIRGTRFNMEIIYNLETEKDGEDDIKLLAEAMTLLHYDYIGGHGSRGYGKIRFNNVKAEAVTGDIDESFIEKINAVLRDVK